MCLKYSHSKGLMGVQTRALPGLPLMRNVAQDLYLLEIEAAVRHAPEPQIFQRHADPDAHSHTTRHRYEHSQVQGLPPTHLLFILLSPSHL